MKKEKLFRQAFKRIVAFVLAIAFIMSGMNVTSWKVEAEDNTVVYDLLNGTPLTESGTVAQDEYGPDIFCEQQFNNLDATMLSNLGTYSSLKFEASVKVNSTSGKMPTVVAYSMDAEYGNWKDDGAEVTALDSEVNVAVDLTSYSTLSRVGVRFTQCDIGTAINYTITSAKITAVKSSGSSGGGDTSVPVEGLSAKVTKLSGNSDWAEFNYSITNGNSTAVKGLKVVIPFSGTVNNFQSFGGCTASKVDNTIVIKHTKEIAANSTFSCTSDDKFGFAGGASLGTPVVSALTEEDNASQLKYPLTGTTQDVAYSDTPVGKHGALHLQEVSGYSTPVIVDESGNPFQLRGASTHGMQWVEDNGDYVNKQAFQSLRDEWGVNMVRLVSYVTQYNGYTCGGQATLDAKIEKGVQAATDLGMYVIVDWHIHAESPYPTKAQALEFFTKYATKYKDNKNVIFEICNEPTGVEWYKNGAGGDLYSYCKEVATVIRDCGSKSLIICGTNTWSQDVDDVAKKPLKDDGFEDILYTFHFYSGSHYADKMNKVKTAIAAGTPIFVTEFGVCDASGNGGYDTANADAWIKLCDENNISYACWSLSYKAESASYFVSSCRKQQGGWLEEDLSTTGLWLVNTYRAHEEAEKEKENPDAVSKVTLDKTTLSLAKGESATLTATVSPSTATDKTVTWKSDKEAVATVDKMGKVTAVGAGTATITVTTTDGGKTATCKVTVTAPGITLDKKTLTLKAGETATLQPTVTGVTDKTVTWTSDKEAVATVDETGKVTAKGSGSATITATVGSGDNAVTASCSVTVTKNTPKVTVPPSITVEAGSKLSGITFDETSFKADVAGIFSWKTTDKTVTIKDNNTKVVVTFTPSDATAYDSIDKEITILVTKKKYDSAPDAPKLSSATANTVTLVQDTGEISVQYGLKQGTSYKWQDDNVFTGLSAYTSYEFAMRYVQTDIYEASGAGKTLKVTTFFNDTDKYIVDVTKLAEENYVDAHGGTISYDKDTKVLTLEESGKTYTIIGNDKDVTIQCADGVTVKLKGTELKSLAGEGVLNLNLDNHSLVAEGITAKGKLTIDNGSTTGVGSLTVTSGEKNAAIAAAEVDILGGQVEATGTGNHNAIEVEGTLSLLGGTVIANAESEIPIVAGKIILDGGQVSSDSNPVFSPDPVDLEGNSVLLCNVTYVNGTDNTKTSVKKGSEITLPSLPAKKGYKANGWKLTGEDIVSLPGEKKTVTEDVTFTADYTEITGTLDVSVSKGNDLIAGYTVDSGVTVTIENNTSVTIDEILLQLDNDKEFTISEDEIIGLEAGKSSVITVALKNGMGVGEYSTDLAITCAEEECDAITKTITRVVSKAAAEKPDTAPEILEVTANSITLVPVLQDDKTVEYGIKQANGSYKWQTGNKFTNLKSYTTYSFAIRYAETDDANASEASDSVSATTLMDANSKYTVDLTKLDEEGYVEAHDGSITYDADKKELTLVEEETYTITGNNPDIKIIVKEAATLDLENAKVQAVEADKDIELVLKGTSSVTSTVDGQPAIKAEGSVTISQTEGAVGSVQATGGDNAAGIEAAEVTIKSGTVTVTGGKDASGIVADKVTVSGGTVAITGQGDKPAVKADTTKFDVPVKTTNGSNYKEEGGDTSEEDKTTQKPDDTTASEKPASSETQDTNTTQSTQDKEDADDDKTIKPALLCSNILLQKGKSIRLQTNDDDVEITKVAYANKKSKKLVNASSSGKVTGKKTGTASLKVTYEYDDVSYTKTVKVKVQKNQVVSLTKKTISLTLKRNKKANLVNPSNMLSSKGMKFTSSNKRCIKVSSSGVVNARKKGSANVTVKIDKTKYTVKIKVK